jgi:hypothetical protein
MATNTLPQGSPATIAWEHALATFSMAQDDLNDLGFDYTDAESELIGGAHSVAILAMAAAPAPDMAAFVRKLEILVADEIIQSCGPYFQLALDTLLIDARRLGGLSS